MILYIALGFQSFFDLKNFGFTLLLMIPITLIGVYVFGLVKFVDDSKNTSQSTLLSNVWQDYLKLVPQLFLRVLGSTLIYGIVMGLTAFALQTIFLALNIDSSQSLFATSGTQFNVKYLAYNLIISFILALFSFHSVLYFFKQVPFYKAMIESVKLAKDNIPFIVLLTVLAVVISLISFSLGTDNNVLRVLSGILSGYETMLHAILVLLYYRQELRQK